MSQAPHRGPMKEARDALPSSAWYHAAKESKGGVKYQVRPMPARDEPTRARLVLLDAEVDVPTSLLGALQIGFLFTAGRGRSLWGAERGTRGIDRLR